MHTSDTLFFLYHFSKDMTLKCNEESRSLSSETFSKVSFTNLRRPAVPDLSTEMGMNIFKKVCRLFFMLSFKPIWYILVFTKPLIKCWYHMQGYLVFLTFNFLYSTMHFILLFYQYFVFFSSLRTVEKIEREKALSHSTILGRNASVEWVYLFWCMRITWMSHPHVAPSHSEASLDWEMTVAHWTVGVGLPLSWVWRAL